MYLYHHVNIVIYIHLKWVSMIRVWDVCIVVWTGPKPAQAAILTVRWQERLIGRSSLWMSPDFLLKGGLMCMCMDGDAVVNNIYLFYRFYLNISLDVYYNLCSTNDSACPLLGIDLPIRFHQSLTVASLPHNVLAYFSVRLSIWWLVFPTFLHPSWCTTPKSSFLPILTSSYSDCYNQILVFNLHAYSLLLQTVPLHSCSLTRHWF